MSDTYVLETSEKEVTDDPSKFNSKFNIRVPDSNGLNYTSNQIVFANLDSLATYDSFLNLKETCIEVPYTVTATSVNDMGPVANNANSMGVKGFTNLIASMQIEYNNNPIINFSQHTHIPVNFRLLTSFSHENVTNMGDDINYYGPESDNFKYDISLGEQNNYNKATSTAQTASARRLRNTNFNFYRSG